MALPSPTHAFQIGDPVQVHGRYRHSDGQFGTLIVEDGWSRYHIDCRGVGQDGTLSGVVSGFRDNKVFIDLDNGWAGARGDFNPDSLHAMLARAA